MQMKRWFWGAFLLISAVGIGTGNYVLFSPKIGKATAAEIEAALPASLKVQDVPDPAGEARYARLVAMSRGLNTKPLNQSTMSPDPLAGRALPENEILLGKIEALLKEGGIRVPTRTMDMQFPDLSRVKNIEKLAAISIAAAQKRGDRRGCERWATLTLRFSQALTDAGGVAIDQLVAVAIDAIAVRAVYLAEIENGLDNQARAAVLGLLPPEDGRSSAMADAVRRDFQVCWTPILLDPQAHLKSLMDSSADVVSDAEPPPGKQPPAGTFDPVASAKLAGGVYDALIADLLRPPTKVVHAEAKLIADAEPGLPEGSYYTGLEGLWYRVRMNVGRNTLGRKGIVSGALVGLTGATGRAAANRNLVRAVILLRSGATPAVIDPFGTGNLRFDRKREIVWSVGKDGRDDGGDIGDGYQDSAPDLGYPYGDHSWAKLHPPLPKSTIRGGPPAGFGPGFPPPGFK